MTSIVDARWNRWVRYAPVWIVFLVFIASVLLAKGIVTTRTTHDLYFVFDSIWRSFLGQTTFVDFRSPIGIGYFLPYRLLAHVESFSLLTLLHGNLVVAGGLLFLASTTLTKRMSPLFFFLTALGVVGVAISPRMADAMPNVFSNLAPYNRWCEAATMVIAPLVLLCPRSVVTGTDRLPKIDIAAAVTLALLVLFVFHVKVTFFLCAVALVAVGLLGRRISVRTVGWAAVVFVAISVVLEATLHFHGRYLADLMMARDASREVDGTLRPLIRPRDLLTVLTYAAAAIGVILLGAPLQGLREWLLRWWGLILLASTGFALAAITHAQNHPQTEIPLMGTLLLVVAESVRRRSLGVRRATSRAVLSLAVVLLGAAWIPTLEAAAVLNHTRMSRSGWVCSLPPWRGTPAEQLLFPRNLLGEPGKPAVGRCEDIRIAPDSYTLNTNPAKPAWADADRFEVARLTDARALFESRVGPRDSIMTLDFANPYPAFTGTVPPRGALLWWDLGRNYSTKAKPEAAILLGNVDRVLVSRVELQLDPAGAKMWKVYGPDVERGFELVAQSRMWQLWSRSSGRSDPAK